MCHGGVGRRSEAVAHALDEGIVGQQLQKHTLVDAGLYQMVEHGEGYTVHKQSHDASSPITSARIPYSAEDARRRPCLDGERLEWPRT